MRCPIFLERSSWMCFHLHCHQTLPLIPDSDVFFELTLTHIWDNYPDGAFAYVRNCHTPDVTYDIITISSMRVRVYS